MSSSNTTNINIINRTNSSANNIPQSASFNLSFSDLQEYTNYEFFVAAHTEVGKGASSKIEARTTQAGIQKLQFRYCPEVL